MIMSRYTFFQALPWSVGELARWDAEKREKCKGRQKKSKEKPAVK